MAGVYIVFQFFVYNLFTVAFPPSFGLWLMLVHPRLNPHLRRGGFFLLLGELLDA
jgi:hypothetical protein